jgi:N-acetylglutamate synthase-like GNAT family acetyltransferase
MASTRPDPESARLRRAAAADVPRMVELIAGANLPPLFVEEYLAGFLVAESGETVIACGGLEMYGDCGVIRSVVVDERARGQGLGLRIAETLMDDARQTGATDLYLFTMDAWPFWRRLGFADVTFEEWKNPARACWQYRLLEENRDMIPEGIHTMWRTA